MSDLDVQNINSKTGNSAITISDTGDVSAGGNAVITTQSLQLASRNLIINGAMQVAQRGTQVTGVTSGGHQACDRFYLQLQSLGTWTVDQSSDAPNGFANSFKVTCTTADPSPAAGDRFFVYQLIEAKNLQHLAFGTPDAKPLSLSFWVKSNKTGSASVDALQNDNANKIFTTTYTINSADTWEYKTISIPADTAGLINNDVNAGFQIDFWMNTGSNSTGGGVTSGWESFDNTKRNSSNLGVGGAVSDYFAITGIQLEVGDVATPFQHRSYGEELLQCQRYYARGYTRLCFNGISGRYSFRTLGQFNMRASPTVAGSFASQGLGTIQGYGQSGLLNTDLKQIYVQTAASSGADGFFTFSADSEI